MQLSKELKKFIEKLCKNCYGKGYSTEYVGKTIAHADFIGDQDRVLANERILINFCSCERGKQIRSLIKQMQIEKLEELKRLGHGGGNWRRIIAQMIGKLENDQT